MQDFRVHTFLSNKLSGRSLSSKTRNIWEADANNGVALYSLSSEFFGFYPVDRQFRAMEEIVEMFSEEVLFCCGETESRNILYNKRIKCTEIDLKHEIHLSVVIKRKPTLVLNFWSWKSWFANMNAAMKLNHFFVAFQQQIDLIQRCLLAPSLQIRCFDSTT